MQRHMWFAAHGARRTAHGALSVGRQAAEHSSGPSHFSVAVGIFKIIKQRTAKGLHLFSNLHTSETVFLSYSSCATNRKVAGSIPDGVIGIFH